MDGDGEVLVLLEDGEVRALVDGALVDGVGHGEVDDAAEEDAVADLGVHVAAVVRKRQDVLHVGLRADLMSTSTTKTSALAQIHFIHYVCVSHFIYA